MKVAYDFQAFSGQKYGGVSRYFCELILSLKADYNIDPKITAPLYVNQYLEDLKKHSLLQVNGLQIPFIPSSTAQRIINKLNTVSSRTQLRTMRPDIIHETYYHPDGCASKNTKVVMTVHDMIHEKFKELFHPKDRLSAVKRKAVERADKVICVSENTKQDLIHFFNTDPKKIEVVYHGCSLNNIDASCHFPEHINSPYILYVGCRGGYKNFKRLLESFASSKKIQQDFSLVCFGGGNFSKTELEQISRLGVPFGKILHASGNDLVLTALYQRASAFIYPSLYEGFGMPLLEAMAFQCPILCSNTSCMPEVVGNAAELFDPNSVGSILKALENVLFSTSRTEELIKNGLERGRYFSWEKCAHQTYQIYVSLL